MPHKQGSKGFVVITFSQTVGVVAVVADVVVVVADVVVVVVAADVVVVVAADVVRVRRNIPKFFLLK